MDKHYTHWKPITKDLPREHYMGMKGFLAGEISKKSGYGANSDTTAAMFGTAMPEVIPLFVKNFPLFDLIRKVPSNGLSHTYAQQTAFTQTTDPNTIAETGFVNDDANTYVRQTSNIAVFAERRSSSLKAQLSGQSQGVDIMDLELRGGLTTLARDVQNETLRYQETYSGTTWTGGTKYTNADGAYDPNGFNGLRFIANNQSPPENSVQVNVATAGWTDHRVLVGVRAVVDNMFDKGADFGNMVIVCSSYAGEALFADELSFVRYIPQNGMVDLSPALRVRAVSTNQGLIPIIMIPAMGSGYNTYTQNSHSTEDMFILDTTTLVMPYLGNPEPSVLTIPTGVNGQLVEMKIPWCMYGLAALAPSLGVGRVQLLKS